MSLSFNVRKVSLTGPTGPATVLYYNEDALSSVATQAAIKLGMGADDVQHVVGTRYQYDVYKKHAGSLSYEGRIEVTPIATSPRYTATIKPSFMFEGHFDATTTQPLSTATIIKKAKGFRSKGYTKAIEALEVGESWYSGVCFGGTQSLTVTRVN